MEIAYVSSNRFNLEIEKNQSGLIPKILSTITTEIRQDLLQQC